IQRIEKLLRRLIPENIEIRTHLVARDTTVLADSVQIEQVLMNLATNARDAMPDGGTLTITSDVIDRQDLAGTVTGGGSAGPFVRISVSDTGFGMDERTRERIFEPFFTTKEMGKGTGLGLATAYGIVKQHRGSIDVESAPGNGSSFHLLFPLISEPAAVSAAQTADVLTGGTETILVAEDDDIIRSLTRSVLKEFGYTVIEAKDGEDAVRLYQENRERIGLLLFDVIMPRKNGKAAFDEIRKTSDVKVLFISGYSADIISSEGILEKGLSFISKPVSPKELLQKVREVLDRPD
ncbi:MAG TPA: ATP-binding protein, partial [Nitrospirota bacterium]